MRIVASLAFVVVAAFVAACPSPSARRSCNSNTDCFVGEHCADGYCVLDDVAGEGEGSVGEGEGEGSVGEGEGEGEGSVGEGEGEGSIGEGEGEGSSGEGEGEGSSGEGEGEGSSGEGEGEGEGVAQFDADVFHVVTGLSGYALVYRVQIPIAAHFDEIGASYAFDGSAAVSSSFSRVGWFLELEDLGSAQIAFAYVEADAPSADVADLGMPTTSVAFICQQQLTNAIVVSNAPNVTNGAANVNCEMWPSNYGENNDAAPSSPASADDATFDFGDGGAAIEDGYGSFQLHNTDEGRTILSFDDWGINEGAVDVGIGPGPTSAPDWTFAANASQFVVKTLEIVVDAPLDAPTIGVNVPGVPANIAAHVPSTETAGYRLVYDLDVPTSADFVDNGIAYDADFSADVPPGSFDRVAYYVELDDKFVWASAETWNVDAKKIGVPLDIVAQHVVRDGHIVSNVVPNTTASSTMSVEMWPTSYKPDNALPIAGASGTEDDAGDMPLRIAGEHYGSMQMFNAGACVFAYNNWGGNGGDSDLGIGTNNVSGASADWTFANNTSQYASRRLQVLVRQR